MIIETKNLLLKKFPGVVIKNTFDWNSKVFKKEDKKLSASDLILYHKVVDELEEEAFNLHAMAPNRAAEIQADISRYRIQHLEYFKL